MSKKNSNLLIKVKSDPKGIRIDKYLSQKLEKYSRSRIQQIISSGNVKVNGVVVGKNYILNEGDEIIVESTEIGNYLRPIKPQDMDLRILLENDNYVIVSKRAGIVTHPSAGHPDNTLVNAAMHHLNELSDVGDRNRPGIVHRLDKDTSGLIIIAKNSHAHNMFTELFKNREIKKEYIALCLGMFEEDAGRISLPIGRSLTDRKKMGISLDKGKKAITEFNVMEKFKDHNCTLLAVSLKTGRTHQIRVHMSFIGHPIIGDSNYGNKDTDKIAGELDLKRQFLHAGKLEFNDPITGEKIKICDKMPEDLKKCLVRLKSKHV